MFQYAPSTVFIDTGDTLSWINFQGLHNVNGEASSISGESFNNPEEFFFPLSQVILKVLASAITHSAFPVSIIMTAQILVMPKQEW